MSDLPEQSGAPPADDDAGLLSIGQVAGLFGVAPETVRSWGRRYALGASGRSSGGHRRFTRTDVAMLSRMQELVAAGYPFADAARRASDSAASSPGPSGDPVPSTGPAGTHRSTRRAGAGGRVLAVPGGSAQARGLARAASRLDARTTTGLIGESLISHGAVATWQNLLVPVLIAAGRRWEQTGAGVDIEHVLTESVVESLRAYSSFLAKPAARPPIVLAGAPEDTHTLPLYVLSAALREQRRPSLLFGARVPFEVVIAAAKRTGAAGIFVWRQMITGDDPAPGVARLRRELRAATSLSLGGPGWNELTAVAGVHRPATLPAALELLFSPDAR